ncbi:MAG: TlpA disulfide reductase family protein [Pseudomonadota bacterium]
MNKKPSFYLLALSLMLFLAFPASAADFAMTDTTGKVHKLSQYKGRWVLVNFWATWCPPCLEEIPDLIELHENKKNNLVVFGIALDYRNGEQVKQFADSMLVSYPIILGDRKMAARIGPVDGLPTTYLYNPQGVLVAHQVGAITRADVENFIRKAEKTTRK